MALRLQVLIAKNTELSRRAADDAIALGRVTVNGKVAQLGSRASLGDEIAIDGDILSIRSEIPSSRIIAYHKPIGEECSRAAERSVYANLPEAEQRWLSVGRLDINTSGLILFSQDGQLTHRLTHPSYAIDREYAVRVHGKVDEEMVDTLRQGVMLEDGEAKFLDIVDCGGGGTNRWFYVVVQQGRNRLVRRLWESQGVEISRLIRVRFAMFILPAKLKPGKWAELSTEEINDLYACVGVQPPVEATTPRKLPQTNRPTNRPDQPRRRSDENRHPRHRPDRDRDHGSTSRPPQSEEHRGTERREWRGAEQNRERPNAGQWNAGQRQERQDRPAQRRDYRDGSPSAGQQQDRRERPNAGQRQERPSHSGSSGYGDRNPRRTDSSPRRASNQAGRRPTTGRTGSSRDTGTSRPPPRSSAPRSRLSKPRSPD